MTVTFAAAFAAGGLSFLSPCVFPLVPGYLSFMTGTAAGQRTSRGRAVAVASSFALGFGLVFVLLGATASSLGQLVADHRRALEIAGGVLVLLFGLHMLGVLRISALLRDVRYHRLPAPRGLLGAAALGAAFGFGWSPCVGPLLGGVLTLAAADGTLAHGVALLAAYALGLAVPFVLAAAAIGHLVQVWRRLGPILPWAERAGGALLAAFGALLLSGNAGWLGSLLPGLETLAL